MLILATIVHIHITRVYSANYYYVASMKRVDASHVGQSVPLFAATTWFIVAFAPLASLNICCHTTTLL